MIHGGEAVYAFQWRRCVFWGLVFSFVLFGMIGCQTAPPRPRGISSARPMLPAVRVDRKRATRPRKPAEAREERKHRHPSRFRRKLRAKYA